MSKATRVPASIDFHALLPARRSNATDDDIKRAYRKIVLKHHPDKRKAQGEDVRTDDDYFTCITKAYEILGKKISVCRTAGAQF